MDSPRSSRSRRLVLGLLLLVLWTLPAGCSGFEELGSVHTAKTVSYVPGVPNFDLEAIGEQSPSDPGVRLYLGIPPASLVFLRDSARFRAAYQVTADLLGPEGDRLVRTETWADTIWSDERMGSEYEPLSRTRRLTAAPGTYLIRVTMRDAEKANPAVRVQRVTVPAASTDETHIGGLRLETADASGTFHTLAQLHLPSRMDSLRAIAALYPGAPTRSVEVEWSVVRYESDHSVADPPYWLTPPHGSIEYLGVDYGAVDTIASSRASLPGSARVDSLTYLLPKLDEGMYRVVLRARIHPENGPVQALEKRRDVSVKNRHFPEVASQAEFIEALDYIARDSEIEYILEPASPARQKDRFDSFWGERARSEAHASQLLETYYGRVQEANLYFTTHKAGWKTDRGMVYVVMGPPIEVEDYVDRQIWYYGYPTNDPRRIYVFERGHSFDERGLTFKNYVLQRRPYYQDFWESRVYDWREGRVL